MRTLLLTGVFVAATSASISLTAQAPASPAPSQTPNPAPAPATRAASVTTIVGCVYREKDVPGRAPNVAERAGLLEDYILAEMPSAPIATAKVPGATAGAVGTSGAATVMYKLEFVDDDKLKSLLGKRVEVTGRIDAEAGDQPAPAPGTKSSTTDKIVGRDQVNLSEFEVSAIKEVAGICPATPDPRP